MNMVNNKPHVLPECCNATTSLPSVLMRRRLPREDTSNSSTGPHSVEGRAPEGVFSDDEQVYGSTDNWHRGRLERGSSISDERTMRR